MAGGPHCLAMCGGLCASLRCSSAPHDAGAWHSGAALHAGRVVAYTALGAGAGAWCKSWLGRAIIWHFSSQLGL
ncbi:MAG: sulfite exporter TauE/SafE family protein [Brachymonas sp.]|nr:sulfite exporter TauE/SafE family protein [Brachymonas sp.]